jgi:hypothetical protein
MIAKLLVNGTLDHNSISGKEESQQGEASTSSSTCSDVHVDETTPYEELAQETGTSNRELETETPHHIFVTAPRASCTNTPIHQYSRQVVK